jgi:2,3-dihydroxybenzoate decarboxylase
MPCPPASIQHFIEAGFDGAIYGFGVETGLHALRMMTAGVFDKFPKLQVIWVTWVKPCHSGRTA